MEARYRVTYPRRVLDRFLELLTEAGDGELRATVEHAAERIHQSLESEPHTFGDPCFPLPNMHADVYVRAISPLLVYYAIHRVEKLVFVKSIDWAPGI